MLGLPDTNIGKTSASEVAFTPAVYLQAFQILKKAQANGSRAVHGLNENQLNAQFRLWLQDNKGLMGRGAKVDTPTLTKMATGFLKSEGSKVKAVPAKESASDVKAQFAENGLDIHIEDIMPNAEMAYDEESEFDPMDLMTPAEIATALLDYAHGAAPFAAVAATLLANQMADVSMEATEALIEKYDSRAKTSEEKDICMLGMDAVMKDEDRMQASEQLELLAKNESDVDAATRLLSLKEGEEEEPSVLSLFQGSMGMGEKKAARIIPLHTAPKQAVPVHKIT